MREIRTSGSTRGRRAADFNPLRVVLLYRLEIGQHQFRIYWNDSKEPHRRPGLGGLIEATGSGAVCPLWG